jgi:hypothetical protein
VHRIPHDPDYIAHLGAAVYAFAYTEWLIFELVRRADGTTTHADLAVMRTGEVARALRRGLIVRGLISDIPDRWEALVQARHDIVHAHPATDGKHGQRLNRWLPGRAAFVSDDRLLAYIADLELLNSDANDLRDQLSD